jgi:hypothetical protein
MQTFQHLGHVEIVLWRLSEARFGSLERDDDLATPADCAQGIDMRQRLVRTGRYGPHEVRTNHSRGAHTRTASWDRIVRASSTGASCSHPGIVKIVVITMVALIESSKGSIRRKLWLLKGTPGSHIFDHRNYLRYKFPKWDL